VPSGPKGQVPSPSHLQKRAIGKGRRKWTPHALSYWWMLHLGMLTPSAQELKLPCMLAVGSEPDPTIADAIAGGLSTQSLSVDRALKFGGAQRARGP